MFTWAKHTGRSGLPTARQPLVGEAMTTLGARLKLVRGNTSQRALAAELGVHENTVSNAERRDSATHDYLVRIAEARNVNLNWLLTGRGAMYLEDRAGGPLLQEKLTLALADALRVLYGSKYNAVPLEARARLLRAGANYLRTIGVSEDAIPDTDSLVRFLKLTADVMAGHEQVAPGGWAPMTRYGPDPANRTEPAGEDASRSTADTGARSPACALR